MHAFGLAVSDVGRVGDVFAKAAAVSNTSVQAMTESMKTASTVGDMYHATLEETGAALTVLAKRNITGTSAGTSLRNLMSELAAPIGKAAERIKQLNLEFYDGQGRLKTFTDQLAELKVKTAGLNEQARIEVFKDLFGERGIKSASALMNDFEVFGKTLDTLKNKTEGFVYGVNAALNGTMQGQLNRTANELSLAFDEAFKSTSAGWSNLVSELTQVVKSDGFKEFLTTVSNGVIKLIHLVRDLGGAMAVTFAGSVVLRGAIALNTYAQAQKAVTLAMAGTEAATKATTAATAALSGVVSRVFWPIAIVTALGAAYLYLSDSIDKAAEAEKRRKNLAMEGADAMAAEAERRQKQADALKEQARAGGSKSAEQAANEVEKKRIFSEIRAAEDRLTGAKAALAKAEAMPSRGDIGASSRRSSAIESAKNVLTETEATLKSLQRQRTLYADLKFSSDNQDTFANVEKVMTGSEALLKNLEDKAAAGVKGVAELITKVKDLRASVTGTNVDKVDLGTSQAKLKEFEAHQKAALALGAYVPRVDRGAKSELGRQLQNESRGIVEQYRHQEQLARSTYDSETRIATSAFKNKLISASDYFSKLNAFQIAYDAKVEQAERDANSSFDKLANKTPEDKKSLKEQIDNERKSIANRQQEKTLADDLNETERLALQYQKEKGDALEFINRLSKQENTSEREASLIVEEYRNSLLTDNERLVRDAGIAAGEAYDRNNDKLQAEIDLLRERIRLTQETRDAKSAKGASTEAEDRSLSNDNDVLNTQVQNQGRNTKAKGKAVDLARDAAKQVAEMKKFEVALQKSIDLTNRLANSFGRVAGAIGGVATAFLTYQDKQIKAQAAFEATKQDDPEAEKKLLSQKTEASVAYYADTAAAAKGFFNENTKGYQIMEIAEKGFRAMELALAIQTHLQKSGLMTAFTGLFVASKGTQAVAETGATAVSVANAGTQASAWGVTAVVKAIASMPFPMNLVAGGITLAAVVAMGAKMVGSVGGGGKVSQDEMAARERQKYQGTGFAYDTSNDGKNNPYEWEMKKSESMANALERMRENSDLALSFSSNQLDTLEKINQGIAGMAGTIVQTAGLRGTKMDEIALGVGSSKSFLGFNKSSTEMLDSGIQFDRWSAPVRDTSGMNMWEILTSYMKNPQSYSTSQTVGQVLQNGVAASSYADMKSSKSKYFGLSKSVDFYRENGEIPTDLKTQMADVIRGMFTNVVDSVKFLDTSRTSTEIERMLQGMTLDSLGLKEISLKGLSTEEVEKELNAVFSNAGDKMVQAVMPNIASYKKATEGYMETLVRVSAGVDAANYALEQLGMTAVNYTAIANKQGDIETEIIRTTILGNEQTKGLSTGIGEMVKVFGGSADELVDTYTKLNAVRETMSLTGARGPDVTRDMIRGAGGLENLTQGMEDFLDGFYTDGEKAVVQASRLNIEFQKLGIAMPSSKEQFRSMVEGIDRTSVEGQKLYGAMINLSGAFAEIADDFGSVDPALAKQRATVTNLIETTNKWFDIVRSAKGLVVDLDKEINGSQTSSADRIQELRDAMASGTVSFEQQLDMAGEIKDLVLEKYQIEKENAQEMIDFGRDLQDYVKDLKTGDLSPLTNRNKLGEANEQYQQALRDLNSADSTVRDRARDNIQDKASALLEAGKTYYASSKSYIDLFNSVTSTLDKVGVQSTSGADPEAVQRKQLDELTSLRALVVEIQTKAKAEYDTSERQLGTQIATLQRMETSLGVMASIPEILRGLPAELAAAMSKFGVDGSGVNVSMKDQITNLYQTLLKRVPDEIGMNSWMNLANSGHSIESIREGIMGSLEYKQIHGSHAGGLDYVPFDGYVAELHRGERVLTETEARRSDNAAGDNEGTREEIRQLRATVERMIEAQEMATEAMVRAMYGSTGDAADKVVEGTKEAAGMAGWSERNRPDIK
jgi:TP901 family phage tail tape measure protein